MQKSWKDRMPITIWWGNKCFKEQITRKVQEQGIYGQIISLDYVATSLWLMT